MDELAFLDATAQAGLVRRKEVTASELLDAAIARVEQLNPELNAVVTPLYEQAKEAASTVSGDAPFSGVPFLLKDLVSEYAGAPRTDGSAFVAGHYVSPVDSELVRRYKRAGLIILGKTNTSEFGLLPTTEPHRFGPTRNPWNTRLGTGGSSGGSSAAVATGMVAAAHANDGGGSIRIPAACCGLVGLKPTRGRNSLAPHYGDIAGGIICEHVVTRSVRDSAAILDATAGPMPGDPYALDAPDCSYAVEAGRDPGRLRIALDTRSLSGLPAHADCAAGAEAAARLCEELGHEVVEASPAIDGKRLLKTFGAVLTAYLCWNIDDWALRIGRTPSVEDFEPVTWRMYQNGLRQSAGDYLLAVEQMQQISRDFAGFFSNREIWLTPTLARPPVPVGYFEYAPNERDRFFARLAEYTGFTLIANATGQPAISLPLHWNGDDLPIGVQLTGRYGDEATLIRLAAQLERARPWADRRPPLRSR